MNENFYFGKKSYYVRVTNAVFAVQERSVASVARKKFLTPLEPINPGPVVVWPLSPLTHFFISCVPNVFLPKCGCSPC